MGNSELTCGRGPQACVLLELILMTDRGRLVGGSRVAAHGAGLGNKQPLVLCLFYRVAANLQDRNSKYLRAPSMGCHSWNLIYSVLPLPVMISKRHSTSPTPLWIYIYSYAMFSFHLPYGFSKKIACISFLTM